MGPKTDRTVKRWHDFWQRDGSGAVSSAGPPEIGELAERAARLRATGRVMAHVKLSAFVTADALVANR